MTEEKRLGSDGYDVSYFITVCTLDRKTTLGKADDGTVFVNEYGVLAHNLIKKLENLLRGVRIDNRAVMPNHVHFIMSVRSLDGQGYMPDSLTLPFTAVSVFKDVTGSVFADIAKGAPSEPPRWQKGYSVHRIRDEAEYSAIYKYVTLNPSLWTDDIHNPENPRFTTWKETGR